MPSTIEILAGPVPGFGPDFNVRHGFEESKHQNENTEILLLVGDLILLEKRANQLLTWNFLEC
jgi:hypothetical protein